MKEIKKINRTFFTNLQNTSGEINYLGELPNKKSKFILIVGSRAYSKYGQLACEKIVKELSGFNQIYILSGLALGIDEIAHKSALRNKIKTLAIPGSGLGENYIYPAKNRKLAEEIIESNGCLLSQFNNNFQATPWSFPKRNYLMAELADIIIIIEATEKSGTLITAKCGLELNKTICVIPGSIFSNNSLGANQLIKDGAYPISSGDEILELLNIKKIDKKIPLSDLSNEERDFINLLKEPLETEILLEKSKLSVDEFFRIISILEIKGLIEQKLGLIKKI